MMNQDPNNAVQEHLLQDSSESSDRKPQLADDSHEVMRDGQPGSDGPPQLQRYYLRTLVLMFVPAIVTAWYGVIWVALVLGIENDDAVKYRTFSGSLIYYSWFIIGVFGLAWSKYGLAGVEVAMLQTPFWRAPDLVAFLQHSNSTWSSPSGWIKAIYHREFHRLWCLLTLASVLPFIAFPLSGLVFEISDGYISNSKHPFVLGMNTTTFNQMYSTISGTPAEMAWRSGAEPIIPGFGVLYTSEDIDRTEHPSLERVPNTLPLTESIPDMFLAPQADVPVSGEAWGLRAKYDCSMVRKASEFTILSQKSKSTISNVVNKTDTTVNPLRQVTLLTPSGDSIDVFPGGSGLGMSENLWMYKEIGTSGLSSGDTVQYNGSGRESKPRVFEYALWQIQFKHFYDDDPRSPKDFPFNTTLNPVIEDMGSPYIMSDGELTANETFFKVQRNERNYTVDSKSVSTPITDFRKPFSNPELVAPSGTVLDMAAPIGVRCVVSSELGTASLDGTTTSFTNFKKVDPELAQGGMNRKALGYVVYQNFRLYNIDELLEASHLRLKESQLNVERYSGYIHTQGLFRAVLLAYGLEALEIMYKLSPTTDSAWLHEGVTASRAGKILGTASLIPGEAAGYIVLVLFCLWSGISLVLGLVYGFRKRHSDKLDGYDVFRRGVYMSDDVKHNDEFASGQTFYQNKTFKALPGT